ncbi:hypothetical protein HU200_031264 [Digitaria exilis]|uniref:Uncharacterized protein n=1 Tax=Digitaria exilis TaxID=1010633 RepID=A0A835BQ78_9POAL|nr:hypothetical protein HU200_031264 [Digitaria exilis]
MTATDSLPEQGQVQMEIRIETITRMKPLQICNQGFGILQPGLSKIMLKNRMPMA